MTDFKTPTKFIFNNAIKRFEDPIGSGTVYNNLITDELRSYLGLALLVKAGEPNTGGVTPPAGIGLEASYTTVPINELFRKYLVLDDLGEYGLDGYRIYRNVIDPPPEEVATASLEHVIVQELKYLANHIKGGELHEDFNFDIGPAMPGFSVKTQLMNLNEYDVQAGDKDFTGGALDPDKDETSLKFAYAFQTIGIQGSSEVIEKEVKVANNFQELFKKADNTNPNIKTIERLKHIVYGGTTTTALKTQETGVLEGGLKVKTGDAGNDIGIDKLYNVLEITVPGVETNDLAGPPNFSSKKYADFYWYARQMQGLLDLKSGIPLDILWPRALAEYSAQSFFAYQIDYQSEKSPLLSMVAGSLPLKNEGDGVLYGEPTTAIPYTFFGVVGNGDLGSLESLIGDADNASYQAFYQWQHVLDTLVSDKVTRLEPHDLNLNEPYSLYKFNTWLAGGASKFQPFPVNEAKLSNKSISNLFRGATLGWKGFKGADLQTLIYSPTERLNNLFIKPQLIGFKVVKSRVPYNTSTAAAYVGDFVENYDAMVVQTFYVNALPSPSQSTVRIFDSQIIYGKEYYYTLFAIYYVDGKFYYYDDVSLTTIPAKYKYNGHPNGKLTLNTYPMLVKKNKEVNPVLKGLISLTGLKKPWPKVDDPDWPASDNWPINPCCRYKGVWGLSTTKTKPGFTTGGVFPGPGYDDAKGFFTVAYDKKDHIIDVAPLLDELYSILSVQWKSQEPFTGFARDSKLRDTLFDSQGNSKLSKETRCYLCRRPNEFYLKNKWQSFLSWFQGRMETAEWKMLQDALNCGEFKGRMTDTQIGLPAKPDAIANVIQNRPFPDATDGLYGFYPSKGSQEYIKDKLIYTNFTNPSMDYNMWMHRCSIRLLAKQNHLTKGKMLKPERLDEFKFTIKELHARRTYEFAVQPSINSTILNFVPLPPDVTFVPLEDTNDKILIKFQTLQKSEFYWQHGDGVVNTLNESAFSKLVAKSVDYVLNNSPLQVGDLGVLSPETDDATLVASSVLARAEQDVKEIHAFKLDRTPASRADIVEAGDKYVLDLRNGETAYFSNLKPNHKYYYIFASRDVTGLYSGGTEIYQVEIIEDSGYSYTTVEIYKFPKDETKQTTKSFKKLLKIKPSFEETLPESVANIGSTNLFSTIKKAGQVDVGLNLQPVKFKIRIRSKKTKRVFDINLKYTQEIEEIYSTKRLKQIKKHSILIDEKET